jgi:hypothetical protein
LSGEVVKGQSPSSQPVLTAVIEFSALLQKMFRTLKLNEIIIVIVKCIP